MPQKMEQLLLILRFTAFSLWLILTALIVPGFQPGGRYFILLYAFFAATGSWFIRPWTAGLDRRARGLIGGIGILPAWLIVKALSSGIHFNGAGLVLAYLGLVLIEMLLPKPVKLLSK